MKKSLLLLTLVVSTTHAQHFQDFLNRVYPASEDRRTAIVDSFMAVHPTLPFIEQDTMVHFIYRGSATSVTVPGDANGWDGNAFPMTNIAGTDFWYRTQIFEADARLDYKFVINRGTWILDPRNPFQITGGFGPNSELRMPRHPAAPEILYYPDIPHGALRDTIFFSPALGNSRTIRVYTPPGYESSSDSLPMILFHDGLEYVSLANANNVIDYLIWKRRIPPILAVFVPPVNRTQEYVSSQINQFSTFIVSELLPYIDQRYRTRRTPASRAVMGASNGGNISLWLGYNYPQVFGKVGAQSSNIIGQISDGFRSTSRRALKLYLDLGTYDIAMLIPLVRNFVPILQSNAYTYRFREYHEGHSWGNWRAHLDEALEFFFEAEATGLGSEERSSIPGEIRLEQNYPNPFNERTVISFRLSTVSDVRLSVSDMLGRDVATLVNNVKEAGNHIVTFEAPRSGVEFSSGVYFYRLRTEVSNRTMKMVLVR